MAAEKREITYDPTTIIVHIRVHTPLTLRHLNDYLIQQWGHDQTAAGWIILDLMRSSVIRLRDWHYDEEHKVVSPLVQLTSEAASGASFSPRRVSLTPLPAISQLVRDVSRERLEVGRILGMSADDLINDTEGVRRSVIQILNAFNSDELRQLSQDLKELKKESL